MDTSAAASVAAGPKIRDKIQWYSWEIFMVFIWLSEAPWKHLIVVLFLQNYWEICYCWGNCYREKVNSQRHVLWVWFSNISYFWSSSNIQQVFLKTLQNLQTTWRFTHSVIYLQLIPLTTGFPLKKGSECLISVTSLSFTLLSFSTCLFLFVILFMVLFLHLVSTNLALSILTF